ncbi:MAG: hypothetical protein V7L26_26205 [Nostoc sp.]|uniref:hypothetical protein n=1 Tax=Nostoc sp. TaxID=1180 RepID=UPI002FF9FA6D
MYKYRQLTQEEKIIVIQERLAKGYPLHSPPHPVENSEFYLITVTGYEHKCRINSEERRQQLLNQLFEYFTYQDIEILAWVVLQNHYHLLVKNVDFTPSDRNFIC